MAVRRQPAVGPTGATGATGSTGATGATGATGPQGTAPAGVPVLHGPYVVDYTDIPHDGDTHTLWTPQVGDVLLRLFPDWQTVVQWESGTLYIGQNVDATVSPSVNVMMAAMAGGIGRHFVADLDNVADAIQGQQVDGSGDGYCVTATIFHTTDPVRIQVNGQNEGGGTVGHVALYALVARAVAP